MNAAFYLSTYASLSLLMSAAFGVAAFVFVLNRKFKFLAHREELKLQNALLISPWLLLGLRALLPSPNVFQPVLRLWSTESLQSFSTNYSENFQNAYLSIPTHSRPLELQGLLSGSAALLVLALLIWGGLFARDLFKLRSLLRTAYPLKKIGRVRVDLSEVMAVPFSYWLPGRVGVVLPTSMLSERDDQKISLLHELQHHRQRDTQWIYLVWLYRVLFFWNPAVYLWDRMLSEVQEFACDESLVDRKKVSSLAYARCLLKVAQTARGQKQGLVCATGLSFLTHEPLLKRRIQEMLIINKNRSYRWLTASCAALLLTGVAFASKSLVQDRRVTRAAAEQMATVARQTSEFPIVVNDLVLKQLNRYLGTPQGREFMRAALARMENYRAVIEAKLGHYKVPHELIAVPIMESKYYNYVPPPDERKRGAGLWMFIMKTALNYGLRVDEDLHGVDERNNVELETDAAMRLFVANKHRFSDWQLSLLAYNAGEGKVQQGIRDTGSRDAWTLIRAGFDNDPDYLPRVMAAILIMMNPTSLD